MTINRGNVYILLAQQEITITSFCKSAGFSRNRFYTVLNSKNITPKTAGRIAKALNVEVTEIIE